MRFLFFVVVATSYLLSDGVVVVVAPEVSGNACFNDCGQASLQGLLLLPSWIIAWMVGLAAMSAPRCAGAAILRALLKPIQDGLALSVSCVILRSVKPGKSRSRDRCPSSPLFLMDCVAMHAAGCG